MKNSPRQKLLASALAVLAVVFVVAGALSRYEISADRIEKPPSVPSEDAGFVDPPLEDPSLADPPLEDPSLTDPPLEDPSLAEPSIPEEPSEPPKPIPTEITDLNLVVNATFTGIKKQDGMLYWTYNPTEKQGKRACPT